jgi:predicted nuclease of predicted toxin-antitoxin system
MMAKFLANENVPSAAVHAAQQAGIDLTWVRDTSPGSDDESVLAMAKTGSRVVVTFDKDFGELAFRKGVGASCGVILLRPRLRSPEFLTKFLLTVLTQDIEWQGHFTVAQEGSIRVVPLPS